jgi:hypothetical protein
MVAIGEAIAGRMNELAAGECGWKNRPSAV